MIAERPRGGRGRTASHDMWVTLGGRRGRVARAISSEVRRSLIALRRADVALVGEAGPVVVVIGLTQRSELDY